mgnify:CR=1 FL=1
MSTAVAEQLPTREIYAASLSTIRTLGRAGLSGEGVAAAAELAYDDFTTKIAEMLKTDTELSGMLDVTRDKQFVVKDGKAAAVDGTPMVDIVRRGFEASRNSEDERMSTVQALRDEGDVMVAEMADKLAVGQSMIVVSMDPKDQLRGKDALFWRRRGYREGIAYIQWYSKVNEAELWGSAYSTDHSDVEKWRDLLSSRSVEIPDDVDPNTFIRHAWVFDGDDAEAKKQALELRKDYYTSVGVSTKRLSVDAYLASNVDLIKATFSTYYPAIARALATGSNQLELQELACQSLTQLRPGSISPDILQQIIRVANRRGFDDAMAVALDELIPYATVEQLRRGLTGIQLHRSVPSVRPSLVAMPPEAIYSMQQNDVHQMVLSGLQSGLAAGRSYGGCSGVNVASDTLNESSEGNLGKQQGLFGGAEGSKEYAAGEDRYGPLTFKCTEGHTNTRKRGELLTECQHTPCKKGSVGCK